MNKSLFLSFLLFLSLGSSAQNIIADSGFEIIDPDQCDENNFPLMHWFNPNLATPDLQYMIEDGNCGTYLSEEYLGITEMLPPANGLASCGLYCCFQPESVNQSREYASTQLTEELLPGETYKITFQIHRRSQWDLAVDRIGFFFSIDAPQSNNHLVMEVEPQAETQGTVLMDSLWSTMELFYTASGGEKFMTMGNFRWPDEMIVIDTESGIKNIKLSYYQFDNVTLEKVLSSEHIEVLDLIQITYVKDFLLISVPSHSIVEFHLTDVMGNLLVDPNTVVGSKSIDLSGISAGIYFVVVSTLGASKTVKIRKG